MNKIFALSMFGILVFSSLVLAQQNDYPYHTKYNIVFHTSNQAELAVMEQRQNMFQHKYNFTCAGECHYKNLEKSTQARLEVKTQKRFLFWNVNSIETYDINEEGELIQARYNFWSRLLNRNKIKT